MGGGNYMKHLTGSLRSRTHRMILSTILLGSTIAIVASPSILAGSFLQVRKTTDPPVAAKGKFGQDLFLAIDHRDLSSVQALIKKGADPNSRNGLEFTPLYLASASYQMDVMQELIKAGASPDAESAYGTPLMFAAATGNVPGANILLSHNVNVNAVRSDGMSVLMMGANSGNPDFVATMVQHKADVNAKDDNDSTALHYAAKNGSAREGEILITAGANVDEIDAQLQTPLMAAAATGHDDFVHVLLKNGAKVNAKDNEGRTPLILATAYGDYPKVVKALVDAGADVKAADTSGRTPAAIAAARNRTQSAKLLGNSTSQMIAKASTMRMPKQAVSASLKLIQHSMSNFVKAASCVSCHQEGLGRMATGLAKDKGFNLDQNVIKAQMGRLNGGMEALRPLHEGALKNPEVMKQVPLIEINEVTSGDSWLLAGMAAHKVPPTKGTAAMTMVMAKQQSPDGSWTFSLPRIPMQSSFFTFTALSIRSLDAYGPKSEAKEISERIGKAKNWLLHAPTKSSEDRASKLLGLMWAKASLADRKKAAEAIRADQHSDGGWSQTPDLQSDAYATGQALYALHEGAGVPVTDPLYQKGVKFLLRTQDEDGSWFVNKRAFPANNYFDSGFPHGQSQYSSFNGTCWAMMALLETLNTK